jgi:hypothetical protein
VSAPGAPKGDIDVLFSAPSIPEQTVCYQVKRIKFGINQLRNATPGKLGFSSESEKERAIRLSPAVSPPNPGAADLVIVLYTGARCTRVADFMPYPDPAQRPLTAKVRVFT